jgi:hypothetical protein
VHLSVVAMEDHGLPHFPSFPQCLADLKVFKTSTGKLYSIIRNRRMGSGAE